MVADRGTVRASPSFRLRSESLNSLRLRRIFDLFDQNGDGVLTAAELGGALERLGLEADPAGLEATVAGYLRPGAEGLAYEDFEALHRALGDALFGGGGEGGGAAAEEAELTEAFKVFDEDGDGFISAGELQAVLGKLGLNGGWEMAEVRQMICSVDENRDGRVDFLEFKHMMQSVTVRTS